jgi:uncharacterized RDD family membrane protein YckC
MQENVNDPITPTRAGLLRILGAICYDTLLLGAILFFATLMVMPVTGGDAIATGNLPFRIYLLGVCALFFCGFWVHGGQTLGMRAWKIRVVGIDGTGIGWRQALLRFAMAIVSWLPCGLGFWWMLFDRDSLTWHDRVSKTYIVRVNI